MSAAEKPAALVLGASGALGGALARELSGRGYRLGLHAFQHPERIPAELRAPGSGWVYAADFRDPAQVAGLAAGFLKDFGRLDVLVWAAGIAKDAPVLAQPEADAREVLAVDLTAPFLFLKAFARTFLKQRGGAVVAIASHAALSGRAGGAAYAMAQAGLLALLKSAAREWGAAGVRVHAVVPPFVPDSAMGRVASPAFVEGVKRKNVLRAGGAPAAEVAKFVGGLLENATASGQVFVLDARIA